MKLGQSMFLFTLIAYVNGLKILGIFPYQGKSHFFVFRVYLRELANRGHDVTVISHFPEENPPPNYREVSLAGTAEVIEGEVPLKSSYLTVIQVGLFLTFTGAENCRTLLENENVKELLEANNKYDVVVTEHFNSDCAFGIAHHLAAPVVGLTSHVLLPWQYRRLGIPSNYAYVPYHFLEGGASPTFFQRLERIIFDCYFNFLYKIVTQRNDHYTLSQHFGDVPPLDSLVREMRFLLVYQHHTLTGSRLLPANVIEVGGYHVQKPNPLTGDLKKFVDSADQGIIYISFGSLIKSSTMLPDQMEVILDTLKELGPKVIWKWENKTQFEEHEHIYADSWLPQNDILSNSKTLAFFSHAGMLGTTEAIHHGVPVIAMPVIGDQPANAASIEECGLGVQLHIRDLTKQKLSMAFSKVLAYDFRQRVKTLSRAWRDRPVSAMDSAIFWTEHAARHNYTYRTRAADVPIYQHLYLDVIALIVILGLSTAIIVQNTINYYYKVQNAQKVKAIKEKTKLGKKKAKRF